VTTRALTQLGSPGALAIGVAALLTGAVAGVAIAFEPALGMALVVAACYAPLAVLNLRLAFVLWVPLLFLEAIPAANYAGKAAGAVLLGVWLGALRTGATAPDVLRRNRRVFELLVLFNVWLTVSILWAVEPARSIDQIWHWWVVALVLALAATIVRTEATARWAAAAFVAGAVLSVLLGFLQGGLTEAVTAGEGGRLGGAAGDPNFLAAGLVAGMVMAAALMTATPGAAARGALGLAIVLCGVGLVMSESRGGMLAALGTALASVVFFRRRRIHAVALVLLAAGAAAVAFAALPGAWERVTTFDSGGSGRSDLWTVAGRVAADHPIVGVGVNNFVAVAGDYTREPGSLQQVHLIVDRPQYVHNVYLQLLAENGIVGLVIFLALALACLRAAWTAARRFERLGMTSMETLAHAVLVAGIGQLAAGLFISSGVDRRLWLLFGFGPALLGIAARAASERGHDEAVTEPASRRGAAPARTRRRARPSA
jgi:O-antigen ligase